MKAFTIAAVAGVLVVASPPASADSISEVEGARAYERQGAYLTRQDWEKLRRYGGNDDGFYSGRYGYEYGYGPSVGVYIGPRYDRRGYYGPYGY